MWSLKDNPNILVLFYEDLKRVRDNNVGLTEWTLGSVFGVVPRNLV